MKPQDFFNESASRNIAVIMSIVEGALGNDERLPFIRKTLLRRVNDIKRDGLVALRAAASNTTCTSVSCDANVTSSVLNNRGGNNA